MNKIKLLLCVIFFISCTSKNILRDQSLKLLKNGKYYHDVRVILNNNILNFHGVNIVSRNDIRLVFLSSFGLTLVSYTYSFITGKKILFFDKKQLKIKESQVYDLLNLILRIYEIKKNICNDSICYDEYRGMHYKYTLVNNLVKKIKISRKDMIEINISITGFEYDEKN